MGILSSKPASKKRKETKLVKAWLLLKIKDRSLKIFRDEKGKYFMSFYHTLEEILFIERLTDTILVIGVYNDLDRFYEKHVVMKRKDGSFIWDYPFFADKLNRGFYLIQKEHQTVFSFKDLPTFLQPLHEFFSKQHI